ncbi:hypothetical protein DL93DRAFT_2053115, partial [Clavulina sp. PMI_390]
SNNITMGSSGSKAARKLPSRPPPAWAGARTNPEAQTPPRRPGLEAQDHKSSSIIEDSKDPQLVAGLHQLGQVNIRRMEVGQNDVRLQSTPANPASKLFESRRTSEEQALSYTQIPNRMSAATLADLLDARKETTSPSDLQALAKTYSIDKSLLATLSRVVNSPSVGERTTVRSVENGEEKVKSKALWVNPSI